MLDLSKDRLTLAQLGSDPVITDAPALLRNISGTQYVLILTEVLLMFLRLTHQFHSSPGENSKVALYFCFNQKK
ncbi:hypothetical protein RRG08_059041 [Elysia crispata]|uniref:Uncharacterized protein n=1 Tax=Elysia crispata TaxID=231223 RepID=A0AAE0ZEV2_9GAST|nr:hypothetical protein RRG08_059041 [Elysia crispata]